MDILEQYEKENPEVSFRAPQWEPSEEYGGLTRFVIHLSRGMIQNEKQANFVLIVLAVCMFIMTIIILVSGSGRLSPSQEGVSVPVAGPSDPRFRNKQLYEK